MPDAVRLIRKLVITNRSQKLRFADEPQFF